jgi:hypothetical protein
MALRAEAFESLFAYKLKVFVIIAFDNINHLR